MDVLPQTGLTLEILVLKGKNIAGNPTLINLGF